MLETTPWIRPVAIFEKICQHHPEIRAGVRRTLERRIWHRQGDVWPRLGFDVTARSQAAKQRRTCGIFGTRNTNGPNPLTRAFRALAGPMLSLMRSADGNQLALKCVVTSIIEAPRKVSASNITPFPLC